MARFSRRYEREVPSSAGPRVLNPAELPANQVYPAGARIAVSVGRVESSGACACRVGRPHLNALPRAGMVTTGRQMFSKGSEGSR